jgi:hypothetical protein
MELLSTFTIVKVAESPVSGVQGAVEVSRKNAINVLSI